MQERQGCSDGWLPSPSRDLGLLLEMGAGWGCRLCPWAQQEGTVGESDLSPYFPQAGKQGTTQPRPCSDHYLLGSGFGRWWGWAVGRSPGQGAHTGHSAALWASTPAGYRTSQESHPPLLHSGEEGQTDGLGPHAMSQGCRCHSISSPSQVHWPKHAIRPASMSSRATQQDYISQTPLQLGRPMWLLLANGMWAQGCYSLHAWLPCDSFHLFANLLKGNGFWGSPKGQDQTMEGAQMSPNVCMEQSSTSPLHQTVMWAGSEFDIWRLSVPAVSSPWIKMN